MAKPIRHFLFIKLILSLCINDLPANANPLIGDKVSPADKGEFPFIVSLGIAPADDPRYHLCTGTLIAKNYILTAAHCFEINEKTKHFLEPSKIVVSVGSNVNVQGVKHKVKSWKTYDEWATEKNLANYTAHLFNDIAIVTLEDEVDNIKPAYVTHRSLKDIYGKNVTAAGWGTTNFGVKPRFLQKAQLRVLSKKECLKNLIAVGEEPVEVSNHFCTAGAENSVILGCGDSGGPILFNGDEVVGINEAVCGIHPNTQHVNVHIRVKFYRKFIMDFIGPQ